MKMTGIVRRIDDLGRVVIPKEIRRSMGISEGDALEVFWEGDYVAFKKYNPHEVNKNECAEFVNKFQGNIKCVSSINGVTTVVVNDGRIGSAKFNPNDEFDFNVAVVYALRNAGIAVDIEGL